MSAMPLPAPRRRGMFGIPMAPGAKQGPFDFSMDEVAGPTMAAAAGQDPAQTPPAYQKPSTLQNIAGTIGDALLSWGGGQAVFGPQQAAMRQTAMQEAQRQRERGENYADWERKQAYERDNPKPVAPHYWETNDGSLGRVGPDGNPEVVYKDPTERIEYQWVRNPDGTMSGIPIPRGGAAPAPAGPPPGVTFTPLPAGGAPQPGARPFR